MIFALGACGGGDDGDGDGDARDRTDAQPADGPAPDAAPPDTRARFSEASPQQLMNVIMVASVAERTSSSVPLLAFLDSALSENNCPVVTATSIVGDCTTTNGTRYEGSAELAPNPAGDFSSVTYRGLRRTDSRGYFYLDGTVDVTQESDEELRYELSMMVEFQTGIEAGRFEVKVSATCRMQDEVNASCTLEDKSAARIEGLGDFTIEGTHAMGTALSERPDSANVIAHGQDNAPIEYDRESGCMTYTLEGGVEQQTCPK